jgi:outer membrane protein W
MPAGRVTPPATQGELPILMSRSVVGGLLALLVTVLPASALASEQLGNGGIGFRGGMIKFLQDETTAEDASPRLSGDLVFSYVYSDHLWLDVTVGYGWNRIGDNTDFWIASSVPLTVGARYQMWDGKKLRPYLGAGGGFYVWSIHSKDLGAAKDPLTFERLRRADPGVYGVVGVERAMSKHIHMTADGLYHYIFAENVEDFPSGYNGNKGYAQIRLGVTFYFTLSERIDTGLPE